MYICIQSEVLWMHPAGPRRSANCRPMDTFAPPPLPIQVINIITVNIVRVSEEVIVSARSASKYFSDSTLDPFGGRGY